jgi:2-dehydropantoate 2-reductase
MFSGCLFLWRMKIAVVGCGAVGSFYGAQLARAGHETHFLLRSDYDVVRQKGVFIRSPKGDFLARPRCARLPQEIGPCDLVLIGLKTTANGEFARLLPPLASPETVILTLQNGLGNEEQLARLFPIGQIMGGLCFVCLNRLDPGLIHHLDYGLVVMGEFQRRPEPRTHELAALFRQAGVACNVTENLARAHWEKLIWNIPFNGLGVAGVAGFEAVLSGQLPAGNALAGGLAPGHCLTTDKLMGDARWERLLRELMLEVIAAARALGFDLAESLAAQQIERTRTMADYKASTLLDFESGRPLELESLFLEPLRQARKAHVATPRLESLCRLLQQIESAKARAGR